MDIMTLLRPAINILKVGEVNLNFGLSELRNTQLIFPKILEKVELTKEEFIKALSLNPETALLKVMNDLLLKDWNEDKNEAGEVLASFLDLLSIVFKTKEHLKDLQVFDLLIKFDEFGQVLGEKLKKNSASIEDTILPNITPKSSTTETEKKPKKKKSRKV